LGYALSTYACPRIVGAIRDGVRSENPVPKRLATWQRKVVKAEEDLAQSLGRQPSLEEVASHMGEELEGLSILPRLNPAASIDELVDIASERGGVPRWMVDGTDPADSAVDAARASDVASALELLPEDQRRAVQLLVMDALSPTEARLETGATARQMRQRKEKALLALRESLSAWA
jgi:RNA polymerase sigma factor for flagellar operon FliA